MKRNKILVSILHRLFTFFFWFTLLFTIYIFGFEVFTKDGHFENFVSENHHANGYSIPIKFNIDVKNPVFNNFKTINLKKGVNIYGQKWSSRNSVYFDELPNDINDEVKNVISFNFYGDTEYYTTTNSSFNTNGYIIGKSDNLLIKILQMFKAYSGLIMLVLVFYFLKKIFYLIKQKYSFTSFLYHNVKWLGLILIIGEVLDLIVTYVLGSYYGSISVETFIDGKSFYDGINLTMNPRLEFDFTLFLVGLSLLVLTSLLKSANILQQENELTI
ncbi:Protein of unknown function (DUF2975) [Lacinutrix venerupis]|uniref:DUF2975 domain-containing protein n=1 Tax=Lacinutrix venerupis TaxID=1486034 RepID=UPI000EAD6330|nr:DUF2975 domain-containing protein [Lacinutrix venerupis]RLJ65482.1 Protein of unknown function (DUF2975) [Lacinutrix venerupis]